MDRILREHKWMTCFGYLDNTLVAIPGHVQQLDALREVLQRFTEAGLTAKLPKCHLGLKDIEFMGHHLSANGLRPSSGKMEAILQYPTPKQPDRRMTFSWAGQLVSTVHF